MKYPKFWQQTPQEKKTSDVLSEINKIGDDAFIRKTSPDLADDLQKAINNTQAFLNKMYIPVGSPAKIGNTLSFPEN